MNHSVSPFLIRTWPVLVALAVAVVGATLVAISGLTSDGYYIIVTGPVYLVVCGLALLVAVSFALRVLPSGAGKWLSILGCSAAMLALASWSGLALGALFNRAYLHWPVSDHRLP